VSSSGTTRGTRTEPVEAEVAVEGAGEHAEAAVARPQARARSGASASAAQRRRRVVALILVANLVTMGVAVAGVIGWVWEAIPATLLVAWLVACRLMVRKERARGRTAPVRKRRTAPPEQVVADEDTVDDTDEIPAVRADRASPVPDGWDPVPVTLPTYVAKATAGRSVRTIDLDSTGVWSSGRNAADSALAREADEQRAEQIEPAERRVSGA
jgi:hypothetical protein